MQFLLLYLFIFLSIILILSVLTKNKGFTRIIIINGICNFFLMYIVGLSYYTDQPYLIDLAFIYTLLNVIGGISFLIYSKFKESNIVKTEITKN